MERSMPLFARFAIRAALIAMPLAAALHERSIVEIFRVNAGGSCNVFANEV